jgi:hypothetical protein
MKEPERLLSSDATDFERQLLESVLDEQPSARLEWRMQRALGLSGPALWLAGAKAAVASTAGQAVSVAIVGASLVAGGAALEAAWSSGEQPPTAKGPAALTGEVTSVPPLEATGVEGLAAAEPATATVAAATAEESSGLREEIELLDAAREAIGRGDGVTAGRLLQSYRQRFPEGVLSREARILERPPPHAAQ